MITSGGLVLFRCLKLTTKKCDNFKNRCKVFDTSIKTIAICMGVAMIAQLGER